MKGDIPGPTPPFEGRVEPHVADSTPAPRRAPDVPSGAPNIVLILLDDVGFGSPDVFGGPVPMPALARVAQAGLRYNQFHTTALCAPTRAALLTGRNHHAVHIGGSAQLTNSYPGYDSSMPREAATVAEALRLHGYSTGIFGKWHLTPTWEQGPAGPYDHWPTRMGFDRFYGIIGPESSQWEPPIYDQTTPIEPYAGRDDYHLTEDLAERAIEWMQRQKASAPDRPFFLYFPTPAVHAPHHVWPEWSDRFRGRFDAGWDALREEIFERQLALGVVPQGTRLTPRPAEIPGWDDYPDAYKPVASRLMEVFAGFLAHTDAQIGRMLDAIDALGCMEDTLVIYVTGDNGASAEGTIHGAWSAPSFQNGVPEDPAWLLEHMDDFGSARCENHYNVGWAWALDAPFQWMKQIASHFGGTRNGLAMSWPARIRDGGGLRSQFHHVVDVVPTLLEAAGIEQPRRVHGIEQMPLHGTSMAYSFDDAGAPERHTTQYFEILGNRAIYHDGWIASCFHGRLPWVRLRGYEFDGPQERWELYCVSDDFSQSADLAANHPEKLAELRALFDREARRNGVYPLIDAASMRPEILVPAALAAPRRMTYTAAHTRVPEPSVVNLKNCSFLITARIAVPEGGASGVIACQGGNMAGWSLYLDPEGRPTFHYNWLGHVHTSLAAPSLAPGEHEIVVRFDYDGGFGAGGDATLHVDDLQAAAARIEKTVPVVFSMSGETFDVGVDTGSPVGPYPHRFPCTARIIGVTLERLGERTAEVRRAMEDGQSRAELSSH